jgi:hypothetical protein
VAKVPILRILWLPIWESWEKWHLDVAPVANHREYYKGEGGGFPPSLDYGESCESMYANCLSVHQKCSNYALTNLLFGLCKSIWIINLLVIHPNPHPRAMAHPLTPEVLWVNECTPIHYFFVVFIFELTFEYFKEFRNYIIMALRKRGKKTDSKPTNAPIMK